MTNKQTTWRDHAEQAAINQVKADILTGQAEAIGALVSADIQAVFGALVDGKLTLSFVEYTERREFTLAALIEEKGGAKGVEDAFERMIKWGYDAKLSTIKPKAEGAAEVKATARSEAKQAAQTIAGDANISDEALEKTADKLYSAAAKAKSESVNLRGDAKKAANKQAASAEKQAKTFADALAMRQKAEADSTKERAQALAEITREAIKEAVKSGNIGLLMKLAEVCQEN